MIADGGWGRSGSTSEPIHIDDVGPGPDDPAGDGRDVVNRRDLHGHRLSVLGRLLQGVDELPEVLDRVDVVLRRRREGVAAHRDHPRLRHRLGHLLAGQVPPDAGFRPLPDLDLDRGSRVEVVRRHPEATRGALHEAPVGVRHQVRMEPPLARVPHDAALIGGHRNRLLRVQADGSI